MTDIFTLPFLFLCSEPVPIKKIIAESTPVEHKENFKDKVKRLQSAAKKVRKPVLVETIKKKRNVVELW